MKPGILAIDIGGTGLKMTVIDDRGSMLTERVRVPTPHPSPPEALLAALESMAARMPDYDRIAVAFPGVVRDGRVLTAPNLDTKLWAGFELQQEISARMRGKPTRLINDADMQGLALVSGKGLEFVMTLGTGIGTSLFRDGELMPHMELAHHPIHKNFTYDQYLGDVERKRIGRKRWNRRLARALELVNVLFNPDRIYLSGGNATRVDLKLDPQRVLIGSNDAGLKGGAALWHSAGTDRHSGTHASAHGGGRPPARAVRADAASKPKPARTKRGAGDAVVPEKQSGRHADAPPENQPVNQPVKQPVKQPKNPPTKQTADQATRQPGAQAKKPAAKRLDSPPGKRLTGKAGKA